MGRDHIIWVQIAQGPIMLAGCAGKLAVLKCLFIYVLYQIPHSAKPDPYYTEELLKKSTW